MTAARLEKKNSQYAQSNTAFSVEIEHMLLFPYKYFTIR
ncbi:hypothetical protein RintRC_1592 [Richelia intracellularis]|nr:hypothetical protein RintRC_1592 [Richelia intracellularis]